MTLTMRKAMVAGSVLILLLLANAIVVADWLARLGLVGLAEGLRAEYVTGTAITIVVVMMVLMVGPARGLTLPVRRCPVCDRELRREGDYCPECGARE
jgi:hypothetical protein